jgi:hypothetical protein
MGEAVFLTCTLDGTQKLFLDLGTDAILNLRLRQLTQVKLFLPAVGFLADVLDADSDDVATLCFSGLGTFSIFKLRLGMQVVLGQRRTIGSQDRFRNATPGPSVEALPGERLQRPARSTDSEFALSGVSGFWQGTAY